MADAALQAKYLTSFLDDPKTWRAKALYTTYWHGSSLTAIGIEAGESTVDRGGNLKFFRFFCIFPLDLWDVLCYSKTVFTINKPVLIGVARDFRRTAGKEEKKKRTSVHSAFPASRSVLRKPQATSCCAGTMYPNTKRQQSV
jgi:hypothetical protein